MLYLCLHLLWCGGGEGGECNEGDGVKDQVSDLRGEGEGGSGNGNGECVGCVVLKEISSLEDSGIGRFWECGFLDTKFDDFWMKC